jgi:hypothetical protein
VEDPSHRDVKSSRSYPPSPECLLPMLEVILARNKSFIMNWLNDKKPSLRGGSVD